MIDTILSLYILNTLTPIPNWIIIMAWVLAIVGGLCEVDNRPVR